jgi:cardiolipin synthase
VFGTEIAAAPWPTLAAVVALVDLALILVVIPWALSIKKEASSAVAWCLLVLLVPLVGSLLFFQFGYNSVHRPLNRKRRHRRSFRLSHPATEREPSAGEPPPEPDHSWEGMARLASRVDAFPVMPGNAVEFYHDGASAFAAMYEAVRQARHHVHAEFYIVEPDAAGREFIALLADKAKAGVEVRLLYDAVGSYRLGGRALSPLRKAGGKIAAFLPVSILRRRLQINLRNHRKILVTDGRVAFTGGMNIGDDYVNKGKQFDHWRDTHLRVEGPASKALQRVFAEDWDFAAHEHLKGPSYFPTIRPMGNVPVQVVQSGPDQELKSIREVYFAAILRARQRVWIASPYFVPDPGLRDALCLAGRTGLDVRLLTVFKPDHVIPYLAARYYYGDALEAGVKVYEYTPGMMHSKLLLVDGAWASVGSANLDNRSLHLNFEANCLFYSPPAVAELERQYKQDLEVSVRLDPLVYARRPLAARLAENACRLLSPVL